MEKKTVVLIGFIVLKFILQYVLISPEYDLHRDEYLYLDQGNHLAWGYLSVPPVTSWISWLIKLLGNGVFWVKFFPALFGVLTLLVVWRTIEELKSNLFALILGATAITFSVLLRLNTLFQPNSLEVLCWTTFFFCIIKYISRQEAKWLFIGSVICAVGFLNKYSIVFLMISIVLAILLTEQRRIFFRSAVYFAGGLALLIVLPNLLWQYQNDFPVIHHMQELSAMQLVNVNLTDFFRSQLLFFIGSIFVLITAFYALIFFAPFKPYRFLFWSFVITMALFISLRAKDYYTIGLYPIYFAFGSVYLSVLFERKGKFILRGISIALPILLFIPLYRVAFPNRSPEYIIQHHERYKKFGLLRWEDGKDHSLPQDFADMLGWKELAGKVDKAYAQMPNHGNTLVLCDNYGQAGAINYYTNKKVRAVSFNADYIEWIELDKEYKHLIRIKDHSEGDDETDEMLETAPYFETAARFDSITNVHAREFGTTVFSFAGAKVNINKRIEDEINEVKNRRYRELSVR